MKQEEIYIERLRPCLEEVENEVLNAKKKYPSDFNSGHEGIAVLEEEFLELQKEIFWGFKEWNGDKLTHKNHIREEARQVAAMAFRIMVELT